MLLVTIPARGQADLPTWTVAGPPAVTLGEGGSPQTELSRVAGAFRLANGMIAVANGATFDIRLFDAKGRYVRTFGRRGAGPGEFENLAFVARAADTAFFYDFRLRRFSTVLLGAEPRLVGARQLTVQNDRGWLDMTGRLSDGRYLAQTAASPRLDGPQGVHRLPTSFGIFDGTASGAIDWLARIDGATMFVHNPTGNIKEATVGASAFSAWAYSAASGSAVWFGESASDSLVMVSGNGQRRTVKLPFPRRGVDARLSAQRRSAALESARSDKGREFIEAQWSGDRVPKIMPYFGGIVPGIRGEAWVREYEQDRYAVIDATGTPRAFVVTPPGLRLVDIGADYVIGIHLDDDGVETVRMYPLNRR